jgi:carbon monoxide dehydrogenase subunit G
MEMTGERRIAAPRQRVWEALNDPAVLQQAIPGCESVERSAEDEFKAKMAIKLGPMSAKLNGKVTLSNVVPPESYTITGEGQGGAMGFFKGGADVRLAEDGPEATVLSYAVRAQVGGKMAQLGARLIDSTAKSMSEQFFDRFAAIVAPPPPAAAEPAEAIATPAEPVPAPAAPAMTDVAPAAAADNAPAVAAPAAPPPPAPGPAPASRSPAAILSAARGGGFVAPPVMDMPAIYEQIGDKLFRPVAGVPPQLVYSIGIIVLLLFVALVVR